MVKAFENSNGNSAARSLLTDLSSPRRSCTVRRNCPSDLPLSPYSPGDVMLRDHEMKDDQQLTLCDQTTQPRDLDIDLQCRCR